MKVYAVFKEGVYRHECGGIFLTSAAARVAAEKLINGEVDEYHSYSVVPFTLDEVTPQSPLVEHAAFGRRKYFTGGDLDEPETILRIRKRDGALIYAKDDAE